MSAELSTTTKPRVAQPATSPSPTRRILRSRLARHGYGWLLVALIVTIVLLFPLYWMAVSSVTPITDLLTLHPHLIPALSHLQLSNYSATFRTYPVVSWLANSALITVGAVVLSLVASIPAGYALSRMGSGGATTAGLLMLVTRVIPGTLLVIPFFVMFEATHLLNTIYGLILADTSIIVPFAAWLLKGFFDSVPREMEQAAMVDGCSQWTAFVKVVVPLASPGIGATAIYAVILGWSDYLFSKTLLINPSHWTISVGSASLISDLTVNWSGLMAMGVISVVPMVIAFILLEPFLVSGMAAGSVVG
jgi:multiple sugar transport system permease protein